jgi:hypothetical protein
MEFEGIALRLIKKMHPNAVIQIASSVLQPGSSRKDIYSYVIIMFSIFAHYDRLVEVNQFK